MHVDRAALEVPDDLGDLERLRRLVEGGLGLAVEPDEQLVHDEQQEEDQQVGQDALRGRGRGLDGPQDPADGVGQVLDRLAQRGLLGDAAAAAAVLRLLLRLLLLLGRRPRLLVGHGVREDVTPPFHNIPTRARLVISRYRPA